MLIWYVYIPPLPLINKKLYNHTTVLGWWKKKNLLPIITRPTRITESTSSLIANILTNDPTNIQCFIMPSTIFDHFHVILWRSTIKQKSKTLESLYRPISDENIECLKEQLSNFNNWNTVLSSNDDPHYVSDQFLKTVGEAYKEKCKKF